jgi:hypothetical protein
MELRRPTLRPLPQCRPPPPLPFTPAPAHTPTSSVIFIDVSVSMPILPKRPQTDPEQNESAYNLSSACVDIVSEGSGRYSVQAEYQSGMLRVDRSDEHVEHRCACPNRFLARFPQQQQLRYRRASPSAQEEEMKLEFQQARRVPAHRNPNGPRRKAVLERRVLALEDEADKREQEPHGLIGHAGLRHRGVIWEVTRVRRSRGKGQLRIVRGDWKREGPSLRLIPHRRRCSQA